MPSNNRDNIRATPARSESLAWLAEKLGQADDFARKPFGYDNPPVALISDLFDIPGVKKTLERVAYDEPLTKGKGLATRMHPETESALFAAPMAIGPTVGLSKLAAKYGAKAGHAGEALADRHITRIMDRGGLPAEMLQAIANG